MKPEDMLALRETFTRHDILLSFNGPFSVSLIEEIGHALRKHLEALAASPSEITDVFATYIELTQNIRHYSRAKDLTEAQSSATVVICRNADGRHVVNAGNVLEYADGEALKQRIDELAPLDKAALKAAYKTQLRQPRDPASTTGAGLGLIDMARRASQPLAASLQRLDERYGFLSLQVVI